MNNYHYCLLETKGGVPIYHNGMHTPFRDIDTHDRYAEMKEDICREHDCDVASTTIISFSLL